MTGPVPDSRFRGGYSKVTICEKLREINDLVQEDTEKDLAVRSLLREVQEMAKKMARRLGEYHRQWNKGFWEDNPDWRKDFERRLAKDYLVPDGTENGS